jgi:hypothetical protein
MDRPEPAAGAEQVQESPSLLPRRRIVRGLGAGGDIHPREAVGAVGESSVLGL